MEGIVITLSTNLLRTFIIRRFMSVYFQTNIEHKNREKIVYFIFLFLTSIIHHVFHFPPANIIIFC